MAIILLVLCIVIIIQVLKIIIKTNIIDKHLIDYFLEYFVLIIAFLCLFFRETVPSNVLISTTISCIIYELISGIYAYYEYVKKEKLNSLSIKNVIDSSELGILLLDGNKKILTNSKMCDILDKMNIKSDFSTNIIKQSQKQISGNYVVNIGNEYYLFDINQNEIIAFDITEEYKLQNELDSQNEKLAKNNNELITNIKNIEKLEKEKNLLKIKNKYHDLLGQNLSVIQQYLDKGEVTNESFEEIKYMIKKMFIDIEEPNDPNTNLKNLIKLHEKNGTRIFVDGNLPTKNKYAKVFFEIIREATTNAIKHANSTEVYVKIKTAENITMTITNNGDKPKPIIVENDGIKGMRKKAASIGADIRIITHPKFLIEVCTNSKGLKIY